MKPLAIDSDFGTIELGGYLVSQVVLREGLSAGLRLLHIAGPNGLVAQLHLTRGLSLESVRFADCLFGWRSPLPHPVHPQFVPLAEPSGLGWLDGFTELLVRCGLTSNGAPEFTAQGQLQFGLHGRIANLPAHSVELHSPRDGELVLSGSVDENRFHFGKWRLTTEFHFRAAEPKIGIRDRVENRSGHRRDFQILYHYNLGSPVLQPGGTIHLPHRRIVPRDSHAATGLSDWSAVNAPQPGSSEQVYFFQPLADRHGQTLAVLASPHKKIASAIEFSVPQLPWFSLWKNLVAVEDGYVIGLEPATNFPNPRNFEQAQGRTVWLEPGSSRTFDLTLHFAATPDATQQLIDRVEAIQAGILPEQQCQPDPAWCKR